MTISDSGRQFIINNEGSIKTQAYKDSAGIYTIGIGCIFLGNRRVQEGDTITEDQANKMFDSNLVPIERCLNSDVKVTLTQNQYDALADWIYNLGIYNFQTSTLLKKINVNANDPTIFQEFQKWDKEMDNGVLTVNQGLLNRRNAEIALWFNNKVPNNIS